MTHVAESGLSPVQLDDMQFRLRTDAGIGFFVSIEKDRQFIRIHTYAPTSKTKSRQDKLEFSHRLCTEIFLPVFSLDSDDDVLINYVYPYQYGLIAEQFVALVHRFASMLNYVVQSFDTEGMFDFGTATVVTNVDSTDAGLVEPSAPDEPKILH